LCLVFREKDLYGAHENAIKSNSSKYDYLDHIELSEFYQKTYTPYKVLACRYGKFNCRNSWTLIGTFMGKCLRLDLSNITSIGNKGTLSVSFSINQSDATVDWSGLSAGMTIYPTHSEDYNTIKASKGISLEPQMIPTITFQNLKRVHIGEPFSQCRSKKKGDSMIYNYMVDMGYPLLTWGILLTRKI
jgi:hypothetical protein